MRAVLVSALWPEKDESPVAQVDLCLWDEFKVSMLNSFSIGERPAQASWDTRISALADAMYLRLSKPISYSEPGVWPPLRTQLVK